MLKHFRVVFFFSFSLSNSHTVIELFLGGLRFPIFFIILLIGVYIKLDGLYFLHYDASKLHFDSDAFFIKVHLDSVLGRLKVILVFTGATPFKALELLPVNLFKSSSSVSAFTVGDTAMTHLATFKKKIETVIA